jgi:hypothetical protein
MELLHERKAFKRIYCDGQAPQRHEDLSTSLAP